METRTCVNGNTYNTCTRVGVSVGTYVGPSSATANLKSSLRADKQAPKGVSRNPTSLGRKKGMESDRD